MRSQTPLLEVDDVQVSYGPSRSLFGVSLSVEAGETLALLGTNGAGKSTLGRAISGLVPCSGGEIRFKGQKISRLSASRIHRLGLTYIPETRGVFRELSVYDNLRMASWSVRSRTDRQQSMKDAFEMFPLLEKRVGQVAGTLSGGEQQMLALARALTIKAELVIADELSLGLAPLMVDQVFSSLELAKERGITIIVIEQFVHRALAFADSCVILSSGTVGWAGEASVAGDEVIGRYLGHETATAAVEVMSQTSADQMAGQKMDTHGSDLH
jgi:branched-chain amino acid transport system ATP-binding protein